MSNYYHDAEQEHINDTMFAHEDYIREAYGSSAIDGDAEAEIEEARQWEGMTKEERAAVEADTLKAELEEAAAWQAQREALIKAEQESEVPF
jgi:hypothetical protein